MKMNKIQKSLAPIRSGSSTALASIALSAVLLGSGCTATLPMGGGDKCALSSNQNADVVLDEALALIDAGCGQANFDTYFNRMLDVSKTAATEPDRSTRIVELLNAAEAEGAITHQGKVETVNSYFNVKFVAANSKNTIFSKGCSNKGPFFRALDAELRLKKIGLMDLSQDVAAYNSAKALSENLKGTFEAACQASGSNS